MSSEAVVDTKLARIQILCLDQAQSFVDAAGRLDQTADAHIIFHLSLLALEEIGRACMLGVQRLDHSGLDRSWIEKSLDDHERKLQWAVWTTMDRISPKDFEEARRFAQQAHTLRLRSLYVDQNSAESDLAPQEQVSPADAGQALNLACARLEQARAKDVSSGQLDELGVWFLDAMANRQLAASLLSKSFMDQYEAMGSDARKWAAWARDEIARVEGETQQLLEAELARTGAARGASKPRWRANVTVWTPSHSLRAKVLAIWNSRIDAIQLLWTGKKDELTLQVTLHNNEPLPSLFGRFSSLSKLCLACLNIGTIGYFWFERAGFEQSLFKNIRDLELDKPMELEPRESFWGTGRVVALTDEDIDRAIQCMLAFLPLPDEVAEPIFAPYLNGLALIAKSDLFFNFDSLARIQFVHSLAAALRHYGGWSGKAEEFEASFHVNFKEFVLDAENREKLLKALKAQGDPEETPLANLRSAKQIVDLFLLRIASHTWADILKRPVSED